jgi:hypothetical protein
MDLLKKGNGASLFTGGGASIQFISGGDSI